VAPIPASCIIHRRAPARPTPEAMTTFATRQVPLPRPATVKLQNLSSRRLIVRDTSRVCTGALPRLPVEFADNGPTCRGQHQDRRLKVYARPTHHGQGVQEETDLIANSYRQERLDGVSAGGTTKLRCRHAGGGLTYLLVRQQTPSACAFSTTPCAG
jgi:hypothetical protein